MKVVNVPPRLRIGAGLLVLTVPLVALQIAFVQRAPWWRLPLREMSLAGGLFAVLLFPLIVLLARGKKWALRVSAVLSTIWILISGALAIETRNPTLGFFTVLIIGFVTAMLFWISREMNRSYFDPGAEWFQGLPEAIPEVSCQIGLPSPSEDHPGPVWKQCRIAQLDEEGAFVFSDQAAFGRERLPEIKDSEQVEVILFHGDRQLRCLGKPIRLLDDHQGLGLRFMGLTPDINKELGDWVERLRGKGYVQ